MKPSRHIIVSFTIGAGLWFFTKSVYAGLLCFSSGVLVDFDHVVEYIIHYGWKDIAFKEVYRASEETDRQEGEHKFSKLYIIFHASEAALLLWGLTILTKNIYFLAVALGYSSHLILDSIANRLHPVSYFLVWRVIKGFNTDRLMRKEKA